MEDYPTGSNNALSVYNLKAIAFKDISADKNGAALRRMMPGSTELEFCWYRYEPFMRLQTRVSGWTRQIYVSSIGDLQQLCFFLTGEYME